MTLTALGPGPIDRPAARRAELAARLDAMRPNRLGRVAGAVLFLALVLYSAIHVELLGAKFVNGLGELASAAWMMLPPRGFEYLPEFLHALAQTVAMAFMGTFIGAVLAVPLAIFAARTTFPVRILQFGFRRFADSLRSLDHLIWALVFVRAVGLGPLAGMMAIAIVDLGTLIKLYSEAIDNIDKGPIEGVRAAGGSRLDEIRYGLLPQVVPNMLSAALYMWESNTRSATILGIVGAGGIGYYLADRLRVYEWGQTSLIIILIVAAVYLIDFVSSSVRGKLIGG
jgi:phosphonate transport system permease protein